MIIINNKFVLRQTPTSPYSHSLLPFEDLPMLWHFGDSIRDGYPPENFAEGGRVKVVTLGDHWNTYFKSGVALVEEGEEVFEGFRSRVEGEEPRPFREVARTEKPQAELVELVFYNSLALSLTGQNDLPPHPDSWELISINAYPDKNTDFPPIQPFALKANYHGWDGGTPTSMSEEEFLELLEESEAYWNKRANIRLC